MKIILQHVSLINSVYFVGQNFLSMYTDRNNFLSLVKIKPNLDYNCIFPIDLAPNGIPSGEKSSRKV